MSRLFSDTTPDSERVHDHDTSCYYEKFRNRSEIAMYGKPLADITPDEARELLNRFCSRPQDLGILISKAWK